MGYVNSVAWSVSEYTRGSGAAFGNSSLSSVQEERTSVQPAISIKRLINKRQNGRIRLDCFMLEDFKEMSRSVLFSLVYAAV